MTKRFTPGQRLRALPGNTLNRMLDLADRLGELGPPPGPGAAPPTADTPVLLAPIKNMTGQDLVERAIVGIDRSGFTPPDIVAGETPAEDENLADAAILAGGTPLEVVTPDAQQHAGKFCVTLAPIRSGGTGWAVVTGLVWVRVEVTDAGHTCVALQTGDTVYFASAASGIPILYRKLQDEEEEEDQEGKQWALVLLGGGGVSGALTASFAVVSEFVSGASGDTDSITPGTGKAYLYDTDAETGIRTKRLEDGSPVEIDLRNYDPASIAIDTGIYIVEGDTFDGTTYYEVLDPFCTPYDSP